MSSLAIIQQTDAVHLITDAAIYDPDGVVVDLASKVTELPNAGCAFATRGAVAVGAPLRTLLQPFQSFDEIADTLPDALRLITTAFDALTGGRAIPEMRHIEVTVAGWSDRMQRMVVGIASTYEACDPNDPQGLSYLPGYQPRVPLYAAPAVMTPPVDLMGVLGRQIETEEDVESLVPETDGLAVFEAQRRSPAVFCGGVHYLVGGFAELTTVTREGISRRILKEWPEDQVGRPLNPEGAVPLDEVRRLAAGHKTERLAA